MEIQGKLVHLLPEQSGTSASGNAWKKQEIVVETAENPQYPKKICFTIFGEDRINSNLQGIKPGDEVKVSFDVESREYQGRWFSNVNAWRVEQVSAGAAAEPPNFTTSDGAFPAAEGDDLPF